MKILNRRKLILTALFAVIVLISTQTLTAQNESSVSNPNLQTTQNAVEDDLKECAEMLDKTLETLSACRDKTAAYLAQIEIAAERMKLKDERIAFYQDLVKRYDERIKYLEKIKCSEVKIFFFIKWKSCRY